VEPEEMRTEKLLSAKEMKVLVPTGFPKHRHLSEIEEQLSLASGQTCYLSHSIPI
jgi:N-acetyl-gamma-glutamylphosphate reductase